MKKKLNNKGFEKTELVILIAVLAIIIIIGIIIGSIFSNRKPKNNGIVMISYNSNGGTGEMTNTECRSGNDCILKNNTFIKEGYEFIGWGTKENETNPTYKLNDKYQATSNTTLYAIWKLKDITITYNANGGTGTMESTVYSYGQNKTTIEENKFEKTGYTFNSWQIYNPSLDKWYGCTDENKTCDGTEKNTTLGWHSREKIKTYYTDQKNWDTTSTQQDVTFYAQWGENAYEIKYELNGGKYGKETPISGVYGSTITISNPIKEGFEFTGWTVKGTDAKIENDKLTVGTSDITLIANWTSKISNYIEYLYNDSTLRKENSLEKDNTNDGNIRYVGSEPKNYINFNNEIWRIIGVFNVNGTKKVKLVREESLLDASWDSSDKKVNIGKGINEWSQADINIMLNNYYAGDVTTCTYCDKTNQATCQNDCTSKIKKLNETAKKMIESVQWNTGGIQYGDKNGKEMVTPLEVYNMERGNRTGKNCKSSGTGGNCTDKVDRTTSWTGKVGMIYPSDYGYASKNSKCKEDITYNESCALDNWLHAKYSYWTISPRDSSWYGNASWLINTKFLGDNVTSEVRGIRPAVYLKENVKLIEGNGSSSNPYKIAI